MQKPAKGVLGVVFLTVFVDLVGFGIVIPIQPFYAKAFGAEPWLITWLGASFSLMQFLFASVWGRLSDRIGRRPVLLASIVVTGLGYVLLGFANSLAILFAARIIAGIGSANIGTAQAIIADSTSREERAKGMGLIGAAFGLGFIFGPAIGGSLSRYGLHVPMFVAAGLCALNLGLAFFLVPETRPLGGAASAPRHGSLSLEAFKNAFRHPGVKQLILTLLIYTSAFSIMEQVLGLFVEKAWVAEADPVQRSRRAAELTSYALVLVGVVATIVQGGLIGRLTKRFGEVALLRTGIVIVSLSLFLIPASQKIGFGLFLAVCGFLALGSGLVNPCLMSLLSRAASRDDQGGILGLGQSMSALGRVFGPAIAGGLFQVRAGSPFWVSSLLVLGCGVIALQIDKSLDSRAGR